MHNKRPSDKRINNRIQPDYNSTRIDGLYSIPFHWKPWLIEHVFAGFEHLQLHRQHRVLAPVHWGPDLEQVGPLQDWYRKHPDGSLLLIFRYLPIDHRCVFAGKPSKFAREPRLGTHFRLYDMRCDASPVQTLHLDEWGFWFFVCSGDGHLPDYSEGPQPNPAGKRLFGLNICRSL